MAHCEYYSGYSADRPSEPPPSIHQPLNVPCSGGNPFRTSPAPATSAFTTLSYRVSALEEQLAKTLAGKTETDQVVQYLLRALADILNKADAATKSNQIISKLHHKLIRTKQANRTLQATLRLVLHLHKHCHRPSAVSKCQLVAFPNPDNLVPPKLAKSQVTEDLIDLFVSEASTAVDVSENDAISSAQAIEEEEGIEIEASTSDEEEAASHNKLTTHDCVEFFQDQYVYRFGHVASRDTNREQSSNKATDEKDSKLDFKSQFSALVSEAKKLASAVRPLPEKDGLPYQDMKEVNYDIALPSLNSSFDSSAITVAPSDRNLTDNPRIKPYYTKEAAWIGSDIFASTFERERAIRNHQQRTGSQDLRFPDFFRYGLHFDLDRARHNVYRTVLVSGLPSTVTMTSLLEHVRGGLVIEAKLLNTESITGHKTAWIVFQREATARAFVNYAKQATITFKGKAVTVTILQTPTWPISLMLQNSISNFKHTRCLEVHKFPHELISPPALRRELRICHALAWDAIEHVAKRDDGVVELRFSSIKYAGQAFGILTKHSKFRRCMTRFVSDPCAQPLPFTVDQIGKFDRSAWDGFANQDTSRIVRGPGFYALD